MTDMQEMLFHQGELQGNGLPWFQKEHTFCCRVASETAARAAMEHGL